MGDDLHVGILQGLEDPLGHVLLESGVDRGDHEIELLEEGIREVERAVGEDIDLGPLEEAEALRFERAVEGVDLLHLPAQAVGGEAAGVFHALGVVADRNIGIAHADAVVGDLAQGERPVARVGVDVEVALDVAVIEDGREAVGEGELDLAAVLAHLGRNPGQAEGGVDLLLGGARDLPLALEDAVLGDLEAFVLGHGAELDVVGLGAREILEGGAVLGAGHEAEVNLAFAVLGRDHDRGLSFAGGQDALDAGGAGEALDDAGSVLAAALLGAGEDVDVAHGLFHAAERPGRLDPVDQAGFLEVIDQGGGDAEGRPDRDALGGLLEELDTLADVLDFFVAHAAEGGQAAVGDDLLEVGEGGDAELIVHELDRFRAQGLDVEEGQEAGREAGEGFLVFLHLAGREVFADLLGDAAPDAGDVLELAGGGDLGDVVRHLVEDAGGAAVGKDLEGLLALDVEGVGDAVEENGQLLVFHGVMEE